MAGVGHVDLFTAEESCLFCCYLYGTSPPIIQRSVLLALLFLFCSHKSKEEPSYVLGQVFLMIDGICQSNFPSVEFHCGPACPSETCPGYQDDYFTSLPTTEGNGTRRRHVYDIMPGRQGNQPVYLYCENKCFEDELYEWVPSDK